MTIKHNMTLARFWSRVNIPSTNGKSNACWEWTGSKTSQNYGVTNDGNRNYILAHRYVAGLSQDITDKVVMHICDNPSCCRPDHLQVGTHFENTHDMIDKGRHPNFNSRLLTADQVHDIRSRQLSRQQYADQYHITKGYVGRIQRHESYRHIV